MTLETTNPDEWRNDTYFCMTCGTPFRSPLFDIAKEYERTIFSGEIIYPEVEVIGSEGIGQYCSEACRSKSRDALLLKENVHATFPDIGPIELCSRCAEPIDMTLFHLTYVESTITGDWDSSIVDSSNVVTLAVVCNKCAPTPKRLIAEAERLIEIDKHTFPIGDLT